MNPITMKKPVTLISMVTIILVVAFSGPALADKYADTIDIYKKSEAVQPFFQPLAKAALASGGPMARARSTRAAR